MEKLPFAPSRRGPGTALAVLLGAACLLMVLLPLAHPQQEPYAFVSGARIDPAPARAAYESSGSNEDLYALLLSLCRRAYLDGAAADTRELQALGRELYARAKAGALDLERIGEPADTTAMLALLRDMGVTPATA